MPSFTKALPYVVSGGSKKEKSFAPNTLVNLIADKSAAGSRTDYVTRRTPGTVFFTDLPDEVTYGLVQWFDTLYAITNSGFYRVTATGDFVYLGLVNIVNHCFVDTTQIHLWFGDGVSLYTYHVQDGLQKIDKNASSVVCLDNYGIVTIVQTGEFDYTPVLANTFPGLNFANAETRPDNLVAVARSEREIWMFGTETIEAFATTGDKDLPFGRVYGSYIPKGCAAGKSIAEYNGFFFFVGVDRRIYITGRFQATVASDDGINNLIKAGRIDDAFAFVYTIGNNSFYQVTFPSLNLTCLLNIEQKLWSYLNFRGEGRHIANCQAFCYGKNIIGSYLSGRLYALDPAAFDDDGDFISCFVASTSLNVNNKLITFDAVEVNIERNSGLPLNLIPKMRIGWSRNGRAYRSIRERSFGEAAGENDKYLTRLNLNQWGQSRFRNFGFWVTDPVDFSIGEIFLTYTI